MTNERAPLNDDAIRTMTGLALMRAMVDGTLPGAPIGALMNMRGVDAGAGFVVFEGVPGPEHYNPLGIVHGGFAATLLDSCMGCAVHTMLAAGVGYTSIDINVTFVRAITSATGPVTARGEIVNVGRRVGTARGTLTDAAGKLLAHGTTSCLIIAMER